MPLLLLPRHNGHRALQTQSRRFSSSSLPSPRPLERGWSHVVSACKRAFERRATLAQYQEKQLFSPVPLPLRDMWYFLQLQMPSHAQVDLEEFLRGAQFAGKTQLLAANSHEFALFAAGEGDMTTASTAASQLESICVPYTYRGLLEASKTAYETKKLILEIQEITIDKAFVSGVGYNQFTESEYADLIEGRDASLLSNQRSFAEDATIEHLTIEVGAQTTEVHKMTLLGDEEALVEQQNYRRWLFESKVSNDGELDWRILAAHGINNRAKEIAPRKSLKEK
uniref:Uncharacterized protein n=1 Tax=Globisporangium ultimum (strain ATCC 200006 / CBS 805.95 / DAOM BR144) TaxID=431595 RepID=K3WT55_GLOUD